MESPIPNLLQIYDEMLAEEHNVVKAVSERLSAGRERERESEREDMEEEVTGQDVREQGEEETASANGATDEQEPEPEPETEEESQAQSADEATTSELTRQRKSVTRAQPSTGSASSGKSKRNRVTNSAGDSRNKRQRQSMAADVEEFKKKDISAFFKQTALIPKDFHQSKNIYGTFSERCSTNDPTIILLLTRLFFLVLEAQVLLISSARCVQYSGKTKTCRPLRPSTVCVRLSRP